MQNIGHSTINCGCDQGCSCEVLLLQGSTSQEQEISRASCLLSFLSDCAIFSVSVIAVSMHEETIRQNFRNIIGSSLVDAASRSGRALGMTCKQGGWDGSRDGVQRVESESS